LLIQINSRKRRLRHLLISCREFLASGLPNMAALISWLQGHHAGKTVIIPFQSPSPYGGWLGLYCTQHPDANLIDASEQIFTILDGDI
jgi:hypothetical protein